MVSIMDVTIAVATAFMAIAPSALEAAASEAAGPRLNQRLKAVVEVEEVVVAITTIIMTDIALVVEVEEVEEEEEVIITITMTDNALVVEVEEVEEAVEVINTMGAAAEEETPSTSLQLFSLHFHLLSADGARGCPAGVQRHRRL